MVDTDMGGGPTAESILESISSEEKGLLLKKLLASIEKPT
jgi:hypothetical protein